jgi:large subunit ribosomal protein L25
MANEHKIDIKKRDNTGKKAVNQLRKDGNIPGIYYSPSTNKSTPIFFTKGQYQEAIKSGARIFNISVSDKKQTVLFKSVQYHPITEEVLHVDLYGIRMDKLVNIKIPVQLTGNPAGVVEEGGVLNQASNEIEIQCLPADIPEFVETDISELNLGDSISVGSIYLDEKITLVTPEDTILASVTHAMKEIEPVVEVDEDELFLDEDGEPIAEGDGEGKDEKKEGDKPAEGGETKAEEKGLGSE